MKRGKERGNDSGWIDGDQSVEQFSNSNIWPECETIFEKKIKGATIYEKIRDKKTHTRYTLL
jgi:hypothetical protein